MNIFLNVPKILDLRAEFKKWRGHKEKLESERPNLLAAVLEQQESDLEGHPDPKGLKAARADLGDWDEKILACANRVVKTREALQQAVEKELERRYQQLPKVKSDLEHQQQYALKEMARGLALIDFYQRYFFKAGQIVDAQLVERTRPDNQLRLDAVRAALAAEMTRLESENPEAQTFLDRQKEVAELEMVWAPPPARQVAMPGKSAADWVPSGPPRGVSREQWIEMQVKALIR